MALRLISIIDFFFFQVGSNEVVTSMRARKRNFKAFVKESGAQVVCFSILLVAGNDEGKNRKSQLMNSWLQA